MISEAELQELASNLRTLFAAVERVRKEIESVSGVSYFSQDARQVALDGMQCDILACDHWIRALIGLRRLVEDKFGGNWQEGFLRTLDTHLEADRAEILMVEYLRNSLTTKIHFKIDNLLKNVLQALKAMPGKTGFWYISDAILEEVGLGRTGKEKKILSVLANLRNSYHSNGIHKNESLSVQVEGMQYDFCRGNRVECASWHHIIVIIGANISVLESILLSTKVSRLRDNEIPDLFASGA
jgi:hypothetical protein